MSWPQSSDYREAFQHPLRCLHDPDLRRGQAATDELGRPSPVAGATADVYDLRAGHDRWAVKCYTRTPGGLGPRYGILFTDQLERESPWLVGFQYLDQGVFIRGRWYPVLKMLWCDGLPLDEFARQADAAALDKLSAAWMELTEQLRHAGMAHTDLHHSHVRVQAESDGSLRLRLIDYDCLYTPALADHAPEKKLNPVYQHPQRLWLSAYNAEADRFGNLVIYTALRCLRQAGPELLRRSNEGLLFRQRDFTEPSTSGLLQMLWRFPDEEVPYLIGRLLLASQGPLTEVPVLPAVIDGKQRHLSEEQRRSVETLLRGDAGATTNQTVRAGGSELSFNMELDSDTQAARPAREADDPEKSSSFDLVADSDPELTLPGAPTTAVLTFKPPTLFKTGALAPPPLPAMPPPLPTLVPLSEFAASRVKVYHTEAWMPQAVAVMKLQGVVQDLGGKVVASVPGLLRIHLMERQTGGGTSENGWSFFDFLKQQPPREPRVLSVVELFLRTTDHANQTRFAVDIHFYPGNDPDLEEMEERDWQAYCDKMFCELRGFLIHAR
jgi:hypothetical protein